MKGGGDKKDVKQGVMETASASIGWLSEAQLYRELLEWSNGDQTGGGLQMAGVWMQHTL